jgi:hypothetical protein
MFLISLGTNVADTVQGVAEDWKLGRSRLYKEGAQ